MSEAGVKALNGAGATGPPNNTKEAPQLFGRQHKPSLGTVFCTELPLTLPSCVGVNTVTRSSRYRAEKPSESCGKSFKQRPD